ncbi:hypothetical protein [Parasitella parasitica]|uniref:Uncharacterized protein n=1 Tax=Parasitella parasitica TaxID=35722 RepID=A0A0B7NFQ8_9FUNG|nr:hypothetical protein [Parasitella parasitica]
MASNKRQKIMTFDIKWCINNASTLSAQNFIEAFNFGDKAAANTRYSAILKTKTFQTNVSNTSQLEQEFEQWKKANKNKLIGTGRYLEPFYFGLRAVIHPPNYDPWDSTYEASSVFTIDELNEIKHYNKQEMPSVHNDTLAYLNLYKEAKTSGQVREVILSKQPWDDQFNRDESHNVDWIRHCYYTIVRELECSGLDGDDKSETWILAHVWTMVYHVFDNLSLSLVRKKKLELGAGEAGRRPNDNDSKYDYVFQDSEISGDTEASVNLTTPNMEVDLCTMLPLLIGQFFELHLVIFFEPPVTFKFGDEKVSKDIIITLIDIANDLSNGVLTKIDALKKVINSLTEDMDPILVKLLLCFKALVETLPSNTQQKKVNEHELCSRYLQPFLQSLFDSNEDDNMLFKWMNTITFSCNSDGDQPAATNNRPDGCIENDRKTIGYVEVKTIDYATNHYKINVDLHRLGIFGKTALSRYSLNKTFQVMAIGKLYI